MIKELPFETSIEDFEQWVQQQDGKAVFSTRDARCCPIAAYLNPKLNGNVGVSRGINEWSELDYMAEPLNTYFLEDWMSDFMFHWDNRKGNTGGKKALLNAVRKAKEVMALDRL